MLLDLFCGAGGASYGYHLAGFPKNEIIGVDIFWFRHYPFKFIKGGAFDALPRILERYPISHIHASPPCKLYSTASASYVRHKPYPDYIPLLRELLDETGLPYVIENVEGAPLIHERTTRLCGTMFTEGVPLTTTGKLRVLRHRLFETNFKVVPPLSPCTPGNPDGTKPHKPNYPKYHKFNGHPYVMTTRSGYAHFGKVDPYKEFVMVVGGGNAPAAACRDAMGIDWMNRDELCEAIPPAYTKWIGEQMLEQFPLSASEQPEFVHYSEITTPGAPRLKREPGKFAA